MQCWSNRLDQGSRRRPTPSSPPCYDLGLHCQARLQPHCLQIPFKPLLQGRRYLCCCLITLAPISRQFRLLSGENCIVGTALLVCISVTKTPRSLGCALQRFEVHIPHGISAPSPHCIKGCWLPKCP